ncbi:MAG TPA: DUF4232 domain-containing protein [Solirubrobacteraceae bacterium]|jgi:hypothetical protein
MKRIALIVALVLAGGAAAVSAASGSGRDAPTSPSAADNHASATAEAARLLGLVALPAGVVNSATEPTGDQHGLSEPTYDEATPNLVDAHAWWTTTASPHAVLAYVAAHLPGGAKASGQSTSSGPPGTVPTESETFALPPVRGVLGERVLGVTTAALAHGVTGIRTDGEAVWLTPRPAWEQIPDGVRRVVFTARGADARGRLGPISTPRTLGGARARRLVSLLNAAEIVQPGVTACPLGFDEAVFLRFTTDTGRTHARATEHPTGCASVTLAIGGQAGPALSDYPSVSDELLRLGAIPVCAARTLSPSVSPPGRNGPANARIITFAFQNRSAVMCRLAGFPHLTVSDASGQRVPLSLTRLGAATVHHEGLATTSILDPGQSAGFGATYTRCRSARAVVHAEVVLPGVARRFRFTVGTSRQPFAPCRGAVGIGNV